MRLSRSSSSLSDVVEIIAVLVMIAAGGATAAFALIAFTISRHERSDEARVQASSRDQIAASILHQILVAGGMRSAEALRHLRRHAAVGARVMTDIDVASWGESYVRISSEQQRAALLETAVRLLSERNEPVPLPQYSALLDLSFSLGFHTDALARLRERYGFDYIDHAKDGRPAHADRSGGATPLFVAATVDRRQLLRTLEIDAASPDRQMIISAYRRLVARHHPDKIVDRSEAAQKTASARFIEITRAYEQLLAIYRD